MKKIILTAIIVIATLVVKAQEIGIRFEKGLSWLQILAKAKAEHKFIFVDCYATWCGPCKLMERDVYPLKEVGDVYNLSFISVKVQMDRTAKDNDTVKSWYAAAEMLQTNYTINAYPAFLFFDENGNAVHKAVGSLQVQNFIQLAADAQDQNKQYYRILKDFQSGKLDTSEEKGLINSFASSDKELAGKMAADYLSRIPRSNLALLANGLLMVQHQDNPQVLAMAIAYVQSHPIKDNLDFITALQARQKIKLIAKEYISHLSDSEIYTPRMLAFIATFTDESKERGFDVFYHHERKVEEITKNNYFAQDQVIKVISKEEFDPLFNIAKENKNEPDWQALSEKIKTKYDARYADMIIVKSKLGWYSYLARDQNDDKYWPEYVTARIAKTEMFRYDTLASQAESINSLSWEIFQRGGTSEQLLIVAGWMKEVTGKNPESPDYLDTYACVLYKAGKDDEAITIEGKILQAASEKQDKGRIAYTESTIGKMKNGEAIWTEKEYQN